MEIRPIKLANGSVAININSEEVPDHLPQQFGIGEIVSRGNGVQVEIYRTTIRIFDYEDTGWHAGYSECIWGRTYCIREADGCPGEVSEYHLLQWNPRPPSASVVAMVTGSIDQAAAINEITRMNNALWAIQRLVRDFRQREDLLTDTSEVAAVLEVIESRALQALGRVAVEPPVVIQAGYSVTNLAS